MCICRYKYSKKVLSPRGRRTLLVVVVMVVVDSSGMRTNKALHKTQPQVALFECAMMPGSYNYYSHLRDAEAPSSTWFHLVQRTTNR